MMVWLTAAFLSLVFPPLVLRAPVKSTGSIKQEQQEEQRHLDLHLSLICKSSTLTTKQIVKLSSFLRFQTSRRDNPH